MLDGFLKATTHNIIVKIQMDFKNAPKHITLLLVQGYSIWLKKSLIHNMFNQIVCQVATLHY